MVPVPSPHDIAATPDIFGEVSELGRFRACAACGGPTTHTNLVAQTGPYTEYDNVLIMDLSGGFGMFFDNLESGNFTLVLCHDCAHDACDKLPWLARLLDPARAHAHTAEYQAANPAHYGWDYDRQKARGDLPLEPPEGITEGKSAL